MDSDSGSASQDPETSGLLTRPSSVGGDTGDSSSSPEGQVTSILSVLRAPIPSHLAQKCKISCNPPTGAKRCKGSTNADPMCVTPLYRVQQYPGVQLGVSASKLFYFACREEISCKKSVINYHIKSTKHRNGKEHLLGKCRNEKTIADALMSYDSAAHPVGATLPESTRVYRVKVVTSFMKAGIPLAKLDDLRELFRQVLPFILHEEMLKIKKEISVKPVLIIFDGTTHVAEAFAVVIRFWMAGMLSSVYVG